MEKLEKEREGNKNEGHRKEGQGQFGNFTVSSVASC